MARLPINRSTAVTQVAPSRQAGLTPNFGAQVAQGLGSLGSAVGGVGAALTAADEKQRAKEKGFRERAALQQFSKDMALLEVDSVNSTGEAGEDLPDRIEQGSAALMEQSLSQFGEEDTTALQQAMQGMQNDSFVRAYKTRSGMRAKSSLRVMSDIVDDTASSLITHPNEENMEAAMDDIDELAFSNPHLDDTQRNALVDQAKSIYGNSFITGVAANGTVDDVDDLEARIRQGAFEDVLDKEQTQQHLASLTAARSAHDVALRDAALDIIKVVASGGKPADERMVLAFADTIKDPRLQTQVLSAYSEAVGSRELVMITKKTPIWRAEEKYQEMLAIPTEGMTAQELSAHQAKLDGFRAGYNKEEIKRDSDPGQAAIDSFPQLAQSLTDFNGQMASGDMVAAGGSLQKYIAGFKAASQQLGMEGAMFPERMNKQIRKQFTEETDMDELIRASAQLESVAGDYHADVMASIFKNESAEWAYGIDSIGSKYGSSFMNGLQDSRGVTDKYKATLGDPTSFGDNIKSSTGKLSELAGTIRPSVDTSAENYTEGMEKAFTGAAMDMVNKGLADNLDDAMDSLVEDFHSRNVVHGHVVVDHGLINNPATMPEKLDRLQGLVADQLRMRTSELHNQFKRSGGPLPDVAADNLVMYNNESGTGVVFLVKGSAALPVEAPMWANMPDGIAQTGQQVAEWSFEWVETNVSLGGATTTRRREEADFIRAQREGIDTANRNAFSRDSIERFSKAGMLGRETERVIEELNNADTE